MCKKKKVRNMHFFPSPLQKVVISFCSIFSLFFFLLERDETRRVGGTDTGTTVVNGLVGKGELAEVVTDHLRLDLNSVESFAVVDTDDRADHGGGDDFVAAVGVDRIGLLTLGGKLLGLEDLAHEDGVLDLLATGTAATLTGREELVDVLLAHVEELVELDTSVLELLEGSLDGCLRHLLLVVFSGSFLPKKI